METQNLTTLRIHQLSTAQYNRELANGNIEEDALYLTPDLPYENATTSKAGLMSIEDKVLMNTLIPIVTTGTSGYYEGTIDGLTNLYIGLHITIIPHVESEESTNFLNINALGNKQIFQWNNILNLEPISFIKANVPLNLIYTGTNWIAEDLVREKLENLEGILPVEHGGTGISTLENNSYLVTDDTGAMTFKTNTAVLQDIAAAPEVHEHIISDITDFPETMPPSEHTQSASTITSGTFGGKVMAKDTSIADVTVSQVRNIYAGVEDMQAGVTELPSGTIYFVYEP